MAGRSRMPAERERELLGIALALVRERGYEQVTVDDIAAAARASTATLYRRWGGKARMVISALADGEPEAPADVDTGSLRGDLLALAARAAGPFRPPDLRAAAMTGLARDALLDPGLMRALREITVEPQAELLRRVLRRHAEAGRIAAGNPILDLADRVLFGPLLFEQVYAGDDPGLAERLVDEVLLPLLLAAPI
ncbi:TetR-like C-terminal domain-containing protein [Dactylosporangium sp. CA-092794]|uniref:TetR-like C-terminal domain-containing protein n=1 Tax=Dactylosporangium sp. CA-092794 TaxID=3239929 RepID=UPI003D90E1E6